jgi:cytoskeleton protein RodZ
MAQTIGQQLKQVREERNLTIEKVVQATRIRARQIEAIESDDFESLPSPVQARAFLRIYAEFLDLSLEELIAHQRTGTEEVHLILPDPEPDAAILDQAQIPVEPTVFVADAVTEPAQSMAQNAQLTLKGIFGRIKQIVNRSKNSAPPVTPVEDILPSEAEPEGTNDAEVEVERSVPLAETSSTLLEPRKSQVIFSAIGETLRQRRETLSLTFDEIERHTHVRTHYLQALEAGEFDHLPSSVQARGMLNNYAHFLDMDVDSLLLQFADGLQTRRIERQPKPVEKHQNPAPKTRFKIDLPPNLRRYLSMDILVGAGLILLLLVFAIWGTSRIIGLRAGSTPQPTAPSISDILAASPVSITSTPSPTNAAGIGTVPPLAGETAVATVPAGSQGVVHVVVVALESTWVRVVVDGKIKYEGRITPGTAYPYDGGTQIEVLTGNGAAVGILYNQSNLGPMGTLGEVVDHIYTANAILNPTATFTPSPTITPIPSITPRPSPTLRPSATPRRSLTPTH